MFIGTVIHGDKYARNLGFPTANLDNSLQSLGLENGVYAAYVHYDGGTYKGALVVDDSYPKVEVHLLHFSDDIYNKQLQVDPVTKISDIVPFEHEVDLRAKIAHDICTVDHILD